MSCPYERLRTPGTAWSDAKQIAEQRDCPPAELAALVQVEACQRRARQLQRLHPGAARQAHVPQAARRQVDALQRAAPLQPQVPGDRMRHFRARTCPRMSDWLDSGCQHALDPCFAAKGSLLNRDQCGVTVGCLGQASCRALKHYDRLLSWMPALSPPNMTRRCRWLVGVSQCPAGQHRGSRAVRRT